MTKILNPINELKQEQKELASKIRTDHDDWDSVILRHQHIAYCELRGRSRDQIENPANNNKPDEDWVTRIKNELKEKIKTWRTE